MPIISADAAGEPILLVTDLPTSLQSAELVDIMVAGANSRAVRIAPCLATTTNEDVLAEAKLVLIGAVKRWIDAGSGALQAQQAGPFGMTVDTRQRTGYNLWPSEIEALQQICSTGAGREAFALDTTATSSLSGHPPYCDLYFGGETCSCGYTLTGVAPIYEPYEF